MKKSKQTSDIFYNFAKNKLFKLNRSLTGKGTQETLRHKKKIPKLKIYKIKPKQNI